jgi:hypothetical protein
MPAGGGPLRGRDLFAPGVGAALLVALLIGNPLTSADTRGLVIVAPYALPGAHAFHFSTIAPVNTSGTTNCIGPGSHASMTLATFSLKSGRGEYGARVSYISCGRVIGPAGTTSFARFTLRG